MKNSLSANLLHPLIYLKKISRRYQTNCREIQNLVSPHYAHNPMKIPVGKWKHSDTLFLLGSGPTINQFSETQWKIISDSDSAGWNFWLYHEFVPTYFFFEIPDAKMPCEILKKLLKLRSGDYRDTPVIMSDISQASKRCSKTGVGEWEKLICFEDIPNFFAIHNIGIPGKSLQQMQSWMRYYTWSGVFNASSNLWYLPKRRASLCMLILFGVMCGYKKIVLCGIDYNQPGYFYDHERYSHLPQFERIQGSINPTADVAINPITVAHVVHSLNQEVLKRKGISLYVSNPSSPLHPELPVYPEFLT